MANKKSDVSKETGDGAPIAPVATIQAPPPRIKRIERQGSSSEPYTRRWPQVRGGTCEFCGVMDKREPAHLQYKLCPHYRNMTLACSYCDDTKDPNQVIYHSTLNIAEHPDNPDQLVVWCNQKTCTDAHIKRFKKSRS